MASFLDLLQKARQDQARTQQAFSKPDRVSQTIDALKYLSDSQRQAKADERLMKSDERAIQSHERTMEAYEAQKQSRISNSIVNQMNNIMGDVTTNYNNANIDTRLKVFDDNFDISNLDGPGIDAVQGMKSLAKMQKNRNNEYNLLTTSGYREIDEELGNLIGSIEAGTLVADDADKIKNLVRKIVSNHGKLTTEYKDRLGDDPSKKVELDTSLLNAKDALRYISDDILTVSEKNALGQAIASNSLKPIQDLDANIEYQSRENRSDLKSSINDRIKQQNDTYQMLEDGFIVKEEKDPITQDTVIKEIPIPKEGAYYKSLMQKYNKTNEEIQNLSTKLGKTSVTGEDYLEQVGYIYKDFSMPKTILPPVKGVKEFEPEEGTTEYKRRRVGVDYASDVKVTEDIEDSLARIPALEMVTEKELEGALPESDNVKKLQLGEDIPKTNDGYANISSYADKYKGDALAAGTGAVILSLSQSEKIKSVAKSGTEYLKTALKVPDQEIAKLILDDDVKKWSQRIDSQLDEVNKLKKLKEAQTAKQGFSVIHDKKLKEALRKYKQLTEKANKVLGTRYSNVKQKDMLKILRNPDKWNLWKLKAATGSAMRQSYRAGTDIAKIGGKGLLKATPLDAAIIAWNMGDKAGLEGISKGAVTAGAYMGTKKLLKSISNKGGFMKAIQNPTLRSKVGQHLIKKSPKLAAKMGLKLTAGAASQGAPFIGQAIGGAMLAWTANDIRKLITGNKEIGMMFQDWVEGKYEDKE